MSRFSQIFQDVSSSNLRTPLLLFAGFMIGRSYARFNSRQAILNKKVEEQNDNQPVQAVCVITGEPSFKNVSGIVRFSQLPRSSNVTIEAEITGLTKGKHGIHIHEYGDLTKGCASAGAHFNPFGKKHGGPLDLERHVGDLGNIEVTSDGGGGPAVATLKLEDNWVSLRGSRSVIGRSIVLHQNEDDLGKGGKPDSPTTGNAGPRVACGVIALADATKLQPSPPPQPHVK